MRNGDKLSLATFSIDMRFAPKDVDQAVRLLLSVKEHIRAKHGCHACTIGREADDPGLIHYHEEWESAEWLRRHVRSEEFQRVLIATDLACEEPRIVVGNLSGQSGMAHLHALREEGGQLPILGNEPPSA
jgi:quinol monooxygenase YgiN